MKRRTYLRATGVAAAAGLAGCLSGGGSEEAANEFGYETMVTDGVAVPLVPTADAAEWFEDGEVVFVDARTRVDEFEDLRISDAVFSPAPGGLDDDDPVGELSTDTRLVTYCVCPHTLATSRGSTLIENGYVHAYALNDGLQDWVEKGHPVDGTQAHAAQSVEFNHDYDEQV